MLTQEQYDAFLDDLKSVYEKHGLYLGTCDGCPPIVFETDNIPADQEIDDFVFDRGFVLSDEGRN